MVLLWILLLCGHVVENAGLLSVIDECASSTCKCAGQDIFCGSKNLVLIPTFRKTLTKYKNIYLQNNRLTTIHAHDFANLETEDEVFIDLSHNDISRYEEGAFSRLGNVRLRLFLYDNRIQFPEVLRNVSVKELAVNKLSSLDVTTMFNLGATLEKLTLGMESFSSWPEALRSLRHLKNLTLSNVQMSTIPDSAFHGLEHSLTALSFSSSKLMRFPDALCRLINLNSLSLSHKPSSESEEMIPHCQQRLALLKSLTLNDAKLKSFPAFFQSFPHVVNLTISGNPDLRFISENRAENGTIVNLIDISRNGFRQIPWSLKAFRYLRDLDISYNQISTIEGNDFTSKTPLVRLNLAGNPIDYISDLAFGPIHYLKELDLQHTNLTTIPKAVLSLSLPTAIDLRNNRIECSCDLLWISSWAKKTQAPFVGNCFYSSETISTFVLRDLPDCI